MHLLRSAGTLIGSLALLVLIQGCSSSGGSDEPAASPASSEEIFDIAVSGSVGDGPVVDATLSLYSQDGELLADTVADQLAGYNVQVRTKGKHYPIRIEASGGTDLVTGLPLDFEMSSAVTTPRNHAIANINPYTTLAMAAADRMSGGSGANNLSAALSTVLAEFNFGMTSEISRDPMTIPVDDANLAEVVKSSEALAETIRRSAAALRAAGTPASNQDVIDAIAADIVDGTLDGRGTSGTSRRVSATTTLVAGQVAIEAIRNELVVNGQIATAVLDSVVMQLSSGTAPLTDSRPVTAYLIELASHGVDAAIALGASAEVEAVRDALATLRSGESAASARQALPNTAAEALTASITQMGGGSDADIDLVLSASSTSASANSAPEISGTPATAVAVGTAYQFEPTASDADGDTLLFSIVNQPGWASFSTVTGALIGTPSSGDVGSYADIRIRVSDGQEITSLPAFTITVESASSSPPPNTPPTISGTPAASVVSGALYDFLPSAGDADGDTLTFGIVNRPAWASFSTVTGELTGTPGAGDVGTYADIRISVSDGAASTSLPAFSITVEAAPSQNNAPVISGSPSTSVLQDALYSFAPAASDADGDTLTFSIVNRPPWASFSTVTGALTGTPGAGDVGTYADIRISVSDGTASASLPAFSITVEAVALGSATLSWEAPTTNVDGSPLVDLAGYRIRWGTASGSYSNSVKVMNPGITTYVVDNLTSGTHFFAVTALNSVGAESDLSNEATKTIP